MLNYALDNADIVREGILRQQSHGFRFSTIQSYRVVVTKYRHPSRMSATATRLTWCVM